MTHEQYPHNPEHSVFMHPEVVQYRNGDAAFRFVTHGDRTPLGFGSGYQHTTDLYGDHMAIIVTEAGETYGLAHGSVIVADGRSAEMARLDTIDITIGEPCTVPGVGITNPVSEVLVRFNTPYRMWDEFQIDADSPFTDLERKAAELEERRKAQN